MLKPIPLMSLCLLLAACSAGDPAAEPDLPALPPQAADYITGMVRVSDLTPDPSTSTLDLDLRDTRDGFWFEPQLDLDRINIVCPSGRIMNVGAWMINLSVEPGRRYAEGEDFVVFSSTKDPPTSGYAPICDGGCAPEREKNGTWSCVCSGM